MMDNMPMVTAVSDRPHLQGPFRMGLAAIALFFGGLLLWSLIAPISSAAIAQGQVRVESHRKTIQHLEGGILRELLVKEGDVVRKGQILARLDDTQASATNGLYQGQWDALKVLEARLLAERDGLPAITFDAGISARLADPAVAEMAAGQQRIFTSRRQSLAGEADIIRQKIAQLNAEIGAHRAQARSADEQMRLARDETQDIRTLLEQGLSTKPRLLAMERQIAKLQGDKGQYMGMAARAQQMIAEANLELTNLRSTRSKEVIEEIRDVQTKLAEFDERLRAAADVRRRTALVAPQAGRVVNIKHFTPGGVVQPGQAIMDIVPLGDTLVIDARVSPYDIDTVAAGLTAEVKLSAYKQRQLPVVMGSVLSVSADALVDERSGDSYYVAQIALPPGEVEKLKGARLYPGMPAEVFIVTGRKSAIRFLLEPIFDSYRRSFREA